MFPLNERGACSNCDITSNTYQKTFLFHGLLHCLYYFIPGIRDTYYLLLLLLLLLSPSLLLISLLLISLLLISLLRRIFGVKGNENGELRRLHNEELHSLYRSPNIVRVIKSRRLRWAGHIARMEEDKSTFKTDR